MSKARAINTLWMLKCAGEGRRFARATREVERTQTRRLRRILARNRETWFGRAHRFAAIRDYEDFCERVPLSRYEGYAEAIARVAAGEPNVLTRDAVVLLEPTSGTSGGEKLIPYTASLRREFQRGVATWIADLFRHRPAARRGRAYWSISPACGEPRRTESGIPIGFDDDAAYLGRLERFAVRKILAAPPALARLPDIDAWRYCTLFYLLRVENMSLISIWSPTFFTSLISNLEPWLDRLADDLEAGALRPPAKVPGGVLERLRSGLRPAPRRAAFVRAAWRDSQSPGQFLSAMWPRLALVSCWADAAAARYVQPLRSLLPGVELQPKGLLATEGCVSLPRVGRAGAALAVRSHFFEFQRADGRLRRAHQLDAGGRYRVVITTGGGLYRYQLRDEIEVVGFEQQCPLLRFVGKADRASDLVGEKLVESHVNAVLEEVLSRFNLQPEFVLLAPTDPPQAGYRLYLQGRELGRRTQLPAAVGDAVQRGLEQNPHYRYACRLGQLAPIEIRLLAAEGPSPWRAYEQHCLALGRKPGDIKPTLFDPARGWQARLERGFPDP